MKHTWYECHGKHESPGCMFCDGGLGACTVCNGFEGTLTTDCCGRKMTEDEERRVYKEGTLDFQNGAWLELQPNAGNNLREPGTGERQVD